MKDPLPTFQSLVWRWCRDCFFLWGHFSVHLGGLFFRLFFYTKSVPSVKFGSKLGQGRGKMKQEKETEETNSLLWDTSTACPEKLWMPSPWQCSRPGSTGLWATWSSGRCPCPWQGCWK